MVDRMGEPAPVQDARLQVATRYEFRHGRITRSDVLTPVHTLAVKALELVFATFSTGARATAPGAVRFADGEVRGFDARGFQSCAAAPVDAAPYRSPSGPFKSLVTCSSGPFSLSRPVSLSWTIGYR
jgi:hypothetical protein